MPSSPLDIDIHGDKTMRALAAAMALFLVTSSALAANFQSRPPQTEGPEGARVGDPPGPLAAPSLAVEATADYDTQGAG